jgi:hypothetical protein
MLLNSKIGSVQLFSRYETRSLSTILLSFVNIPTKSAYNAINCARFSDMGLSTGFTNRIHQICSHNLNS